MGLAAGNLITLTNNGTDNLTLNNSASSVSQVFTFATKLTNGAPYNLTLSPTTPTPQPCTSTYGAGIINAANVTNLNVICGQSGGSSTFTGTGPLTTARDYHTATLLPNGRVLVSGGSSGTAALPSAELYDPATGTWTAAGTLGTPRYNHTATLLPDGRVLVSGGYSGTAALTSAELYDPATGIWSVTGSLGTPCDYHTATLLPNGRVLVSGGYNGTAVLPSAELYW